MLFRVLGSNPARQRRALYAEFRLLKAKKRAVAAPTSQEQQRAERWARAWWHWMDGFCNPSGTT